MNYDQELKILKEDLDQAKNLKNKAEGTLEELKKQEEQILKQLEDLGVDPKNLDNEINKLKKEIEDLLSQAQSMIPRDLIKGK